MNPLAVCALLGLGCAAPVKHYEILGMTAGLAREVMQADWDSTANNPRAPERMYEVMRDSVAVWPTGPDGTDTLYVLYVLEVRRVTPRYADPLRFVPSYEPINPVIHTHQNQCPMTHWGPQWDECSNTSPESHQCHPSIQDQRVQVLEGHPYDAIMCDRSGWVFYFPRRT